MGWSGLGGRAAAAVLALLCSLSASSLAFSRRISVLDVARADVSPSLLVLWACKLSNALAPSVGQGLGGSATVAAAPSEGAVDHATPVANVSRVAGFFARNELAFIFPFVVLAAIQCNHTFWIVEA